MAQQGTRMVLAAILVGGLGACASIVGTNESTVQISTNPEGADCVVKGHGGFSQALRTPASVTLPTSAAPMTVTCSAEGRRPTSFTLDATASGWVWGNSALIAVTGGAAVLGLMVDEGLGSGRAYAETVRYELDKDKPRVVNTVERQGGATMTLQAR